MVVLPYITIILCSLVGLSVALYIDWSKRHDEKILCPTESDCEMVIHSRYSTLSGIPWEDIGALYYFLIAVSYFTFWMVPPLATSLTLTVTALISVVASAVAGYLIYIQARVLKEWCTLCLLSSLMCFSILLATLALWL